MNLPRSSNRIATAGEDAATENRTLFAKFSKTFNQLFLQAIKLIAFRRARGDLIFRPNPHWKNAASYSDVGVSALFSSSRLADAVRAESRRGIGDDLLRLRGTGEQNPVCFGIRNFVISSSLAMTRSTTTGHIWCSSAVTSSSFFPFWASVNL